MPVTTFDSKTALLVIDLQKGISAYPLLHPLDGIVANANTLISAFRAKSLPVVFVVVNGVAKGRADVGRRGGGELPAGYTDLLPELDVQPGDLHFAKQTPGAFPHTGLEEKLRELGVTQVVVIGIATSNGVESTARQAYELGFNVTLPIDAMTDGDIDVHNYSIQKIFPRIAETGTTQDVVDVLSGGAE